MMGLSENIAWIGSALAVWATVWAFLQQVLPGRYRSRIFDFLSPYAYYEVHEIEGFSDNELYDFVNIYLSHLTAHRSRRSHLLIPKNGRETQYTLSRGQYIKDTFSGETMRWEHRIFERRNSAWRPSVGESSDARQFELRLLHKNKGKFLDAYIASIREKAKLLDKTNRELRLHSNRKKNEWPYRNSAWNHIPFRHPANFDTIALDQELKDAILTDLEEFADGKEFYRDVGKAWKRGYLLYGPPGTGKTSVVAAMANKLQYDIYDLELTEVKSNSQLRELLTYTDSKSIIVIEDIDCSLDLSKRKKKKKKESSEGTPATPGAPPKSEEDKPSEVTLSGLLNFTDGLWSACEDERIFVFTTNYVDKLDPALLRSGRMDMHINLSYLKFNALKSLASSFFKIKWHAAYPQLEELMKEGAKIAPSQAAEIMMRNRRKPDVAMEKLEELLREKLAHPPPPEPKPEDCLKMAEEDEEEDDESPKKAEEGKKEKSTEKTGDEEKKEKSTEKTGDEVKKEKSTEKIGDEEKKEKEEKKGEEVEKKTVGTQVEEISIDKEGVEECVEAIPSDKKND